MTDAPLNFAAAANAPEAAPRKPPLAVVQLEGLALLKIAKHCKEALAANAAVTGQLLGLDVGQTLEVTDCFPFPGADDEGDPAGGEGFQLEMMRCLRELNVDSNTVGWYQSSAGGAFQAVEVVDTFVSYLESLERCVCVVYDAAAAAAGSLGVRAVRLSEPFVAAYKAGKLTAEGVREGMLTWRDVFVEVPVTVRNSPMAAALAAELAPPAPASALDLDRLALDAGPALSRGLTALSDCLDDLAGEQGKLSYHHAALRRHSQAVAAWKLARRQENQARRAAGEELLTEEPPEGEFKKPAEPSQLDGMLLSAQMAAYAGQVRATAGRAVQKLALLQGLQKAL
jgi:translation initiation factor 3 subunit H